MSHNNSSAIFGVKSNNPIEFIHQFRLLNVRNSMLGSRLANIRFGSLSPYTAAAIELISSRCAEAGIEVSPREFKWIIYTMECAEDKRISLEVEEVVCRILSLVSVSRSTSLVRDSAVALTIAKMAAECDSQQVKKFTQEQVLSEIEKCFQIFGLTCYLGDEKICDGREINEDSHSKLLSMLSLGLNSHGEMASKVTLSGMSKNTTESVSELIGSGVKPNVGRFLIYQYALSGLWPVDAQWIVPNSYYYGGEKSLGALTDPFPWEKKTAEKESEKPPEKPKSSGDWTDDAKGAGIGVVTDILKTLTNVGGKYLESQIKQAEEDATAALKIKTAKALGLSEFDVSDSEVLAYAKSNPEDAKQATEKSLKNAGISGDDIKQMMAIMMSQAQSSKEDKEEKDNTMMYVAAGVGAIAVGGLLIALLSRRN